jgi:hypothetical protein
VVTLMALISISKGVLQVVLRTLTGYAYENHRQKANNAYETFT